MGNIVLLDDLTINQIAAGEVIERPASAVKELVENSIDAGATNISVEIKNGGISYIRITDNGKGIMPDDMEIAFERHATSKIRNAEDLETVKSMGFRGEALASISAIARVEMCSKTEESAIGYKIVVEGGNIISKEECGCPKGTTITVENLFFNTPVRYKFLKKDFTEFGYIEDAITRIALINPNISIKLINTGKNVIQTSGNNDMKAVLYNIYGKDISQNSLEVNYTYEDIKVTGVIGKPEIARSNRSNQLFFVNKRYVKDKTLTSAAEKAYKGLLSIGKYAFLILNLEIDPHKVDVNVHPAKLEVRFEEESKVFKAVYHAIKETLLKENIITEADKVKNTSIPKEESFIKNQFNEINKPSSTKVSENTNAIFGDFFKKMMTPQEKSKAYENDLNKNNPIEDIYNKRENKISEDSNVLEKNNTTEIINENINKNSNDAELKDILIKQELDLKKQLANLEKLVNLENIEDEEKIENKENLKNNENDEDNKDNENNEIVEDLKKIVNIENTEKKESTENTVHLESTENIEETNELKNIDNIEKQKNEDSINIVMEKVHKLKETKMEVDAENFEEMYAKMFGKLPKENVEEKVESEENKLKEEAIEYHFEDSDVENISLFSNSNLNNIPNYKFIGIAFSTYIIIEMNKEMYIIDERTAYEKIMYEKIKKNYYSSGPKESQLMLLPDIITLTHKEMGIAKDNMELFEKAGFTLEEFGENTIKISGVPDVCIDLDIKKLFLETLEEINTVARNEEQEIEEKLISTLARKVAEKANMAINKDEVNELMKELLVLQEPFIGKNGSKGAIRMSRAEIEKKFSRR